jgi:hypothetical protein
MKITFWGVRGSIPTPLTPQRLQNKIASVIQRVEPKDLVSPESREAFLADLPPYLLGTVGGNTTCIELRLADDTMVIFDAGSGIRELGAELKKRNDHVRHYHIFFRIFIGITYRDFHSFPQFSLIQGARSPSTARLPGSSRSSATRCDIPISPSR